MGFGLIFCYCCGFRSSEVSFSVGTCLIPHPKKVVLFIYFWCIYLSLAQFVVLVKVDKGGEDAFFVSNYNGGVIAVADGVSGYLLSHKLQFYIITVNLNFDVMHHIEILFWDNLSQHVFVLCFAVGLKRMWILLCSRAN